MCGVYGVWFVWCVVCVVCGAWCDVVWCPVLAFLLVRCALPAVFLLGVPSWRSSLLLQACRSEVGVLSRSSLLVVLKQEFCPASWRVVLKQEFVPLLGALLRSLKCVLGATRLHSTLASSGLMTGQTAIDNADDMIDKHLTITPRNADLIDCTADMIQTLWRTLFCSPSLVTPWAFASCRWTPC